jgi:hypothetical protein
VAEAVRTLAVAVGGDNVEIVEGPYDLVARILDEGSEERAILACGTPPFIRALPCRVRQTMPGTERRNPRGVST